jgi:hypothetical protein
VRATLFLGDLATALERLDPADAAIERRIAELLGLPVTQALLEEPPLLPPLPEPAPQPLPPSPEPPQTVVSFIPSRLESHRPEGKAPSFQLTTERTPPSATGSERDEPRPPLEPLLAPLSTRTILTAALSTPVSSGIDVSRAIERVARREPLDRLPLRTRQSMRRGIQLLHDKSSGMMPFLRDQASFSAAVVRVAGRQRVASGAFIGSPLRGLTRGLRGVRPYAFPTRGTPVVLLTDLGIAEPEALDNAASTEEWLRFATAARQAGCPVIAFVPYPPRRWPAPLRRVMTILQWDRPLTTGRARRAVRR